MLKRELQVNAAYLPYKNLAVALLFSLFFGPLGLLYSSVWGGVLMIVMAFVVFSNHFPVPIILMWISCSIWSAAATNRYNHKIMGNRIEINHEEKNHASPDPK